MGVERKVVYDGDTRRTPQLRIDPVISGSAAAIIGHMVASTDGFNIGDKDHVEHVKTAIAEIVPAWISAVADACQQSGSE